MKILLTNDDGLSSEGIQALASVLRSGGNTDIWIIAPSENRSAVSHGITMHEPLRLWVRGEQEFACSGLPVDCAIVSMHGILGGRPDVIISGINAGANMGTDLIYSGTAAAARQAAMAGIPGIAVSLESDDGNYVWEPLAFFVQKNLDTLISLCDKDIFLNINARSGLQYKGARLTGISYRDYRDSTVIHDGPDGCKYSFFCPGNIQTDGDGFSDWDAVKEGYISVSRVLAQPVSALCENDIEFIM
ncbi:5'/3'-nucleotidase SurE [Brucepastera parasyntrophica]|uniref:5'/3'-nucleotidase SurE n=1 Tax=Brucepastera parasyntrophica TaxID=2880008 RepID=UPI00210A9509|nr:5'/3'-nucleotidase SurE [Brucepastera parasyntrophica]ULQ59783.1 5'/3'-nucleotidase SurE [Brucepastera parasyntrophica]